MTEPYTRGEPVLRFALSGKPAPQGSKSYGGQSKSGKAILRESSKALKPWRIEVVKVMRSVIATASAPGGFPLLGPVAVDVVFTWPKPQSASKTRRTWPITMPDVDKLARAILDAGKIAGLYGDDAQVVSLHADKAYPGETSRSLPHPGVVVYVYQLDPPAIVGEQGALL